MIFIRFSVLLLFYFIFFESTAQSRISNKQIDSLIKVNATFVHVDPKKSFELTKKILAESEKNNYDLGKAVGLRKMSLYYSQITLDYEKATMYNAKSFEIAQKIGNDSLLLHLTFEKGVLYGNLGMHEKAIQMLEDCLKKTEKIKNFKRRKLFTGDVYNFIFVLLRERKPPPSNEILLNNSIKAMNEYEQALDICINPGYTNVGVCYINLKQYDSATYYLKKAVKFFKLRNIITCELEYSDLAGVYGVMGKYEEALKYTDSSNTICLRDPNKNYNLISENFRMNKEIYQIKKDKDEELKYRNLELTYRDSFNMQQKKQIKGSASYLITETEIKNEELNNTNKMIVIGATMIIIIAILVRIIYRRRNRKLQKQSRKDLQIKTTEIQQLKQKVSASYDELIEMAKKDNPLFVSFFKELYPEFYKKLKEIQPELTIVEQKVCFYLKLKFTTKQIADYSCVSIKAIQNRKNRLRKRLYIDDKKDIYDWIDDLD